MAISRRDPGTPAGLDVADPDAATADEGRPPTGDMLNERDGGVASDNDGGVARSIAAMAGSGIGAIGRGVQVGGESTVRDRAPTSPGTMAAAPGAAVPNSETPAVPSTERSAVDDAARSGAPDELVDASLVADAEVAGASLVADAEVAGAALVADAEVADASLVADAEVAGAALVAEGVEPDAGPGRGWKLDFPPSDDVPRAPAGAGEPRVPPVGAVCDPVEPTAPSAGVLNPATAPAPTGSDRVDSVPVGFSRAMRAAI